MERFYFTTKVISDDAGAIGGIAWKYDVPDRIGDVIAAGAFGKAAMPIPMLFGHDMNDPVGTWDGAEDKAGAFHVTGKLLVDEVARAREVRALVRSGAVKGLSVGFVIKKAEGRPGGRLIRKAELIEVSLVTVGMHPNAKVTSAKSAVQALRIAEALNRATAHFGRT